MRPALFLGTILVACASFAQVGLAQVAAPPAADAPETRAESVRESGGVAKAIERALDLVGIRYRRGGNDTDTGFDCSGFVGYVFREALGLVLPRTAREISSTGAPVARTELEPGDLVFFHTMRQAFSHVGIYLGNNQFIHAPRPGFAVRIEDLRERYWARRYNGARRLGSD